MHPAFSVIFLTTLIGAGQGLFLALYLAEFLTALQALPARDEGFYVAGGVLSLALLGAGLLASFFHLGHPERAWRTAAMWRTSWLSREVIVLPAMMALTAAWTAVHGMHAGLFFAGAGGAGRYDDLSLLLGAAGVAATFVLFLSTGMIYACIKFLQEWATPLTVLNFTLLGCASGFTLATAAAGWGEAGLLGLFGSWAVGLTLVAALFRIASLVRNDRLKPRSNLPSAIGVRHSKITQRAQGASAGSFNTREFFHGATPRLLRSMRWMFLVLAFVLPLLMLPAGLAFASPLLLSSAFVVQFAGLIAERWYFFAQANHPQNLYYQYVS